MPFDENIIENKAIIKLKGDIDLEKTEELRDQAIQTLHNNEALEFDMSKVDYIDSSGINMDGTSNRGMFYEKALNIFSENILFGHGIFRYTIRAGEFYAHNIFLDILVQGGIILMILFLFLLLCFFNKLRKILKYDSKSNLILIFVIYSFTQLLFTGIYLQDTFFWFSLAYVFSYSFKPQLIHNNIDE